MLKCLAVVVCLLLFFNYGYSSVERGATWNEFCDGPVCTLTSYGSKVNLEVDGVYKPFTEVVVFGWDTNHFVLTYGKKSLEIVPSVGLDAPVVGKEEKTFDEFMANNLTATSTQNIAAYDSGSGYKFDLAFKSMEQKTMDELDFVQFKVANLVGFNDKDIVQDGNGIVIEGLIRIDFTDLVETGFDLNIPDKMTYKASSFDTTKSEVVLDPSVSVQSSVADVEITYSGSPATWDTMHDAATGTSIEYGYFTMNAGPWMGSDTNILDRIFLYFDTSAIPDEATIVDANVSIYCDRGNYDSGLPVGLSLQKGTQHAIPSTADYDSFTGNLLNYVSWSTSGYEYREFDLNFTAINDINRDGNTLYAVRDYYFDFLDDQPIPESHPWNDRHNIAIGGTTSNQPKMDVQYYSVNVVATKVDGNPFAGELPYFSYVQDGNLTIDFNVVNFDNNRMNVDINYSLSQSQGTGTSLVVDLNLTSEVCTDQDWNDNYSTCSWDWNTHFVQDANYYILIDLNGGNYNGSSVSSFAASSKAFGVDNNSPTTSWDEDTNTWYNSDQSVNFTCHDNNAGCSTTRYRYKLLPSGSFNPWQTFTTGNPVIFDSEGRWHLDFNSIDRVGNVGDKNTMFLFLDKTKPTVSSNLVENDWNTASPALDVNLTMSAYDVLSGIDANWFRTDDDNTAERNWGPWQSFDRNIIMDWNIFGDGNFGVQYFVVDAANNDSNSDLNGGVVYVLLDQNGPEWPASISPTSGNYVTNVTVTCGSQNWIRDLNYVIDFQEAGGDWNQFYNGTSNSKLLDISWAALDTNMQFRCKAIDPDKNSGYFVGDGNIVANADTGFDSIVNAVPTSSQTIYSASAPFTVDAQDDSGVSFCTFEIYKNGVYDSDANGTPPGGDSDLNNGTWTYNYTNIVNGDLVRAQIYCADNSDNISSKLGTQTYSASISPPAPSGGGGGGGTSIPSEPFEIREPIGKAFNLVRVPGTKEDLVIRVRNEARKNVTFRMAIDANLSDYITCPKYVVVEKGQTGEIVCQVDLNTPEIYQGKIEGKIIVRTASQSTEVAVRINVVGIAGFGALSRFFDTEIGFIVGIVITMASLALVAISVAGLIKPKWVQIVGVFGGAFVALIVVTSLLI